MSRTRSFHVLVGVALLALAALAPTPAAWAQRTTGGIHGKVTGPSGPVADAQITATNATSGYVTLARTDAEGLFRLPALTPGDWEVLVAAPDLQEQRVAVPVRIGQDVALDVSLAQATTVSEVIEVVGVGAEAQIDTKSGTIATNITPQQIENLPQNNRNFLSFAALAPGVAFTLDQDAQGQTFRSGGSNPKQVNVFIDGLSYKNDVIQGGAFMQDSSRGNPFPQNAVQEYKVLTSNFKAEYEKAAAAVITAVTKSGGNDFHGDAFYFGQDKGMVSQDSVSEERGDEKPDYERQQYGLSLGGPIVREKLHYFASYEANKQDRAAFVFRGSSFDSAPANVQQLLSQYPTGTRTVPFDEKLYFGKLSWQPASGQTVDFSYSRRDEEELRGFGNQVTEESAEDFQVGSDAAVLRHQMFLGGGINEASLSWQRLEWHQTARDFTQPHQTYEGILEIGGRASTQDIEQEKLTLRDDFSYFFEGLGSHTAKAGLVYADADYDFVRANDGNPTFIYRSSEGWQYPYKAVYGFGDPRAKFGNEQYGVYLQDDWQILSNLTVNLGVRYDYESNMVNNDFVTPADVANGLRTGCRDYDQPVSGRTRWCITDFLDVENYISDGDNRKSYKGMIQPRVGFAWDVLENGKTVVFGGWGKYYDRITLSDVVDEKFKYSWRRYELCFSLDGSQPSNCGPRAVVWNDAYLSASALDQLVANGNAGAEVFILANDTHPPYTNQWSLGVRQQLGAWNASVSYANSRGYNGTMWSWATQPPDVPWGQQWSYNIPVAGYGGVFRNFDVRRTWYDGYFLTLDKPFTAASRWGFNLAYTYSKGYMQASGDEGAAFAFDFPLYDWPKFAANGDERHHLVMSGSVGLPFGFNVSSIITLGSGAPFTIFDDSGPMFEVRYNAGRPEKKDFILPDAWAYRSVDLRVEWTAPKIADLVEIGLVAEGFNIFDFDNYSAFESFVPRPPAVNANFGNPTAAFNARRFQAGVRVSF